MTKNDPAFIAHHRRIQKARGKASEYLCSCGAQALDWAYRGTAFGWEKRSATGKTYSDDLFNDYAPMCRRCHNRMDDSHVGASMRMRGHPGTPRGGLTTSKIRRRCECGLVSTPGGVGRHQQSKGCATYEDLVA